MNRFSLVNVEVGQLSHFVPEHDQVSERLAWCDGHGRNGVVLGKDTEQSSPLQIPDSNGSILTP